MKSRVDKINFILNDRNTCNFYKINKYKHLGSTISNHRDCLVFASSFCCDFLVGDVNES